MVTEYTRKKDLAPETDIAFLKHNEKTALLEKLGKHFSEEEHLRLKYPRPISQYSVKDITDIIAPGDDLVEDIPRSAALAKMNLNQNGYAVDYDVEQDDAVNYIPEK